MDRRVGDIPYEWIVDKLTTMSETEGRHYNELRSRLDNSIASNQSRIEDHSDRLTVIETERKGEKESSNRAHGLQSTAIGVLLITGWEVLKRKLLGWQ